MQKIHQPRLTATAALTAFTLLLAACGGGAGGGDPATTGGVGSPGTELEFAL